nr:MAG TPA: hypothetical protein [Crassvirales sp.]
MYNLNYRRTIMNKVMILAILVAYKAFNDKSLTIATNEHVYSNVIVNYINDICVIVSSQCDSDDDTYTYSININNIIGIQFQK